MNVVLTKAQLKWDQSENAQPFGWILGQRSPSRMHFYFKKKESVWFSIMTQVCEHANRLIQNNLIPPKINDGNNLK